MNDTISRLAVIQIIEKMRARIGHNLERAVGRAMIEILDEVGEDVGKLPPAQPERIKGRWEQDGHHIKCDQCGEWMCDRDREGWNIPKNYCPNCGAKMEVTE